MLRSLFPVLLALNFLAGATLAGFFGRTGYYGEPERLANQLNPELIQLTTPPLEGPVLVAQAPEEAARTANPPSSGSLSASPEEPAPSAPTPDPSPPDPPPEPPPTPSEPPPVAPPPPASSRASAPAEAVVTPPAAPPPKTRTTEPPRCVRFTRLSPDEAKVLLAQAHKAIPSVRTENTTTEAIRDWWVHIPTAKTRMDADQKVSLLRQIGIQDHFVVRDPGPTQFYVSLGVFTTETAARRYLGSVQRRGVEGATVMPRRMTNHAITLRAPEKELMTFVDKAVKTTAPPLQWQRCR